jgi:RNA recognition motif-containing protein
MKKLYVGNIAWTASEDSLSDLFSEVGKVSSVKIVRDFNTNQSRGFGFVEMSTQEEAEAAMEKLNDQEFSGRRLRLDWAQERKPKRDDYNRDRGFGSRNRW